MVNVSDGKSKPEPLRLNLTMELVTLQRLEIVTPTNPQNGPPSESKVSIKGIIYFQMQSIKTNGVSLLVEWHFRVSRFITILNRYLCNF